MTVYKENKKKYETQFPINPIFLILNNEIEKKNQLEKREKQNSLS